MLVTVFCYLGRINLPDPITSGVSVPHVIVTDEAFPLKPYLMRPFPGRQLDNDERCIFNYRLSRSRQVVENAFGKYTHFIKFM